MTKICRWGNSLGLRLPKETAANAGLLAGARVTVRLLDNGSIIVTPLVTAVAVTEAVTEAPTAVKPPVVAEKW